MWKYEWDMIFFILFFCHDHDVCSRRDFDFYFCHQHRLIGISSFTRDDLVMDRTIHSAQWVQMRWRNREFIVGGAVSVWWVTACPASSSSQASLFRLHDIIMPAESNPARAGTEDSIGGAWIILVRYFEVETIDVAAPPPSRSPAWGISSSTPVTVTRVSLITPGQDQPLRILNWKIGIIELLRIGIPSPL